jgi:hypothetical protein
MTKPRQKKRPESQPCIGWDKGWRLRGDVWVFTYNGECWVYDAKDERQMWKIAYDAPNSKPGLPIRYA